MLGCSPVRTTAARLRRLSGLCLQQSHTLRYARVSMCMFLSYTLTHTKIVCLPSACTWCHEQHVASEGQGLGQQQPQPVVNETCVKYAVQHCATTGSYGHQGCHCMSYTPSRSTQANQLHALSACLTITQIPYFNSKNVTSMNTTYPQCMAPEAGWPCELVHACCDALGITASIRCGNDCALSPVATRPHPHTQSTD